MDLKYNITTNSGDGADALSGSQNTVSTTDDELYVEITDILGEETMISVDGISFQVTSDTRDSFHVRLSVLIEGETVPYVYVVSRNLHLVTYHIM